MSYTLKPDVDLAGSHRRDVSNEPRDWHGRWTRLPGRHAMPEAPTVATYPKSAPKGGSHLTLTSGEKERWTSVGKTPEEIAQHVQDLVMEAQQAEPGTTKYEHAWTAVAANVEELHSHAQAVTAKARREASVRTVKATKATKEVGHVAKERGQEFFTANFLTSLGLHVAAGAGGVLGTAESEHFREAFAHVVENPAGEITVAVIVTFLLNALAMRIRKAIQKHRDKRIHKARAQDPEYTMLPLPKPKPAERQFPQRVSPSTVPLALKP